MALIEDLQEPPSSKNTEKTEKTKILTTKFAKIKNHLYISDKFSVLGSKFSLITRPFAKGWQTGREFVSHLRSFLVSSKYLPHIAVLLLALVVVTSNQRDKLAAQASSAELVTVNPDVEYNVAASVDDFTNLIPDDGSAVERATVATLASDGFVNNSSTVLTSVTERDTEVQVAVSNVPDNSSKTITYEVQSGDTLTGLGWKFGVKIATLKYVNDITNIDNIKPGTTLKIPPKNYEVSPTLIAKKEAQQKSKLAAAGRSTVARGSRTTVNYKAGTKYNGYPYGYCTYYVATIRNVPSSWGDAKHWLDSARGSGYSTGSEPSVGAIVVTSESWWGHVAFVESVNGDSITVSEMNVKGWGVVDRRTLPAYGGAVRGYIY